MFTALLIAGLLACGFLVLRQARRNAASDAASIHKNVSATKSLQPVDDWQRNIRLDTDTDYSQAMEKLRQEERRQNPKEQRN